MKALTFKTEDRVFVAYGPEGYMTVAEIIDGKGRTLPMKYPACTKHLYVMDIGQPWNTSMAALRGMYGRELREPEKLPRAEGQATAPGRDLVVLGLVVGLRRYHLGVHLLGDPGGERMCSEQRKREVAVSSPVIGNRDELLEESRIIREPVPPVIDLDFGAVREPDVIASSPATCGR